jgi:hypothetical protein
VVPIRVRDHIALSTVGAVALRPWLGRGAVGVVAGGVLVDVDHYLWFCVHERRLDPRAAVRRFNEADAPRGPATRSLHGPGAALVLLVMSNRRRGLRPVIAGVGLHLALDRFHEARMARVRVGALKRDGYSCQGCGTRGPHVETHIHKQPSLLPSYRTRNLSSLCGPCHQAAHRCANGIAAWS